MAKTLENRGFNAIVACSAGETDPGMTVSTSCVIVPCIGPWGDMPLQNARKGCFAAEIRPLDRRGSDVVLRGTISGSGETVEKRKKIAILSAA